MTHGNFKENATDPQTGRARAERMYSLEGKVCEVCGTTNYDTVERHHKNGNPLNNEPENIQFLCRYHHMIVDGRIQKPARPCSNCGKLVQVSWIGRCENCYSYWRKNEVERPKRYW